MSLTQETIALSQIEKQRRSYQTLSLTNYNNDLEPQIAAGGRVEDTDTLFYSGSLESITGWAGIAVSTEAYIKIIPQGDGPPETALAEFTDIAPAWSDSKQGFYGTGAAANHRYIGALYKDAGGNYTKKWLYHSINKSNLNIKLYADGSADLAGDIDCSGVIMANAYYWHDVTAGANLLLSQDDEYMTTSTSYVKLKEIVSPSDGIVTTKFGLKSSYAGSAAGGRIYVNGVAVGTAHTNTTTAYVTKTDVSIPVAKDDLIQVYVLAAVAHSAYVNNFRCYCNETVPNAVKGIFAGMGIL